MNFPETLEKIDREYDADSDGTYCSDAEMILKSRAAEVEMLTLNDCTSSIETNIGSISQKSENDVMKHTDSQGRDEQTQSCKLNSKKSVKFQLQRRKNFRNPDLVKKSSRSFKKLQLLEHHRVKMKNHGKTLTKRIFTIRNDVKMWLGGFGLQINKKNCTALYEEVKAIKNILTQLYQASRRLTNYIGGDLPFTYKKYSSANQICETLLIQLNPAAYEDSKHVYRKLNKDGLISSNEDDTDSEHRLTFHLQKKFPRYKHVMSEGNGSNRLNENKIYFMKSVPNCQLMEENVIKTIETGNKSVAQEKNHNFTTSQEHGSCGVIKNFSSLTLNESPTLSQTNIYNNQAKIHHLIQQNDPKSSQIFPVVSDKLSVVNVEMIDLTEDDASSPELINMEVLKTHLNQVHDLPAVTKDCIFKEELVSHDITLSNVDNTQESSEPKESEDLCFSSQTQPNSSYIHRYEMNKTIQGGNINEDSLKKQIKKVLESNYFSFDESSKDDATDIVSSDNINNLIDLKTATIPSKESKCDETFHEETECSAFLSAVQKLKGMKSDNMEKTEEINSNTGSICNTKLNVPSWCYIFEQHKIKNGLPTLIELMLAGMIHPGEKVLTIKDSDIKGSLLKNGKICTPEGATFQSPMAWCSAWSDGKSTSKNQAYQRVHYKGISLMQVCQKAFEIALEELSAANLEKQSSPLTTEPALAVGCPGTELEKDSSSSYLAEEFEEKEPLEDPILAIEAVMFHSPEEFQVDEALERFFLGEGKFIADLEFIDEW